MTICQKIKERFEELLALLREEEELIAKLDEIEDDFEKRIPLLEEIHQRQNEFSDKYWELKRVILFYLRPLYFHRTETIEFEEEKNLDTLRTVEKEKRPYSYHTLCPVAPDLWAVAVCYPRNDPQRAEIHLFKTKDKKIEKQKEPIEIPKGEVRSLAYLPEKDLFLIGYDDKLVSFSLSVNIK